MLGQGSNEAKGTKVCGRGMRTAASAQKTRGAGAEGPCQDRQRRHTGGLQAPDGSLDSVL